MKALQNTVQRGTFGVRSRFLKTPSYMPCQVCEEDAPCCRIAPLLKSNAELLSVGYAPRAQDLLDARIFTHIIRDFDPSMIHLFAPLVRLFVLDRARSVVIGRS